MSDKINEVLEENEDHTLGETGEPNVDCEHYVPEGPGHGLDPRLGVQGDVINLSPNGHGEHDPGVRQQDIEGVGPGFPVKGGPGTK